MEKLAGDLLGVKVWLPILLFLSLLKWCVKMDRSFPLIPFILSTISYSCFLCLRLLVHFKSCLLIWLWMYQVRLQTGTLLVTLSTFPAGPSAQHGRWASWLYLCYNHLGPLGTVLNSVSMMETAYKITTKAKKTIFQVNNPWSHKLLFL